ncbi:MAG: hypothetical protein ACI9KE_005889, partial [Polyangiales bacterium]
MNRNTLLFSLMAVLAVGCGDDSSSGTDTGPQRDSGPGFDGGPGFDAGPDFDAGCIQADIENTTALCSDGCDNDNDGFTDDDPECDIPCPAGEENTMAACTDGCDNDGNTFEDCADFGCAAFCPQENNNLTCSDGADNNMNSFIDCDDRSCSRTDTATMEVIALNVCVNEGHNLGCSDGVDNDSNGMTDCADPACDGENIIVCADGAPVSPLPARADWPALVVAACTDGEDNDGNGFRDCGDNGCRFSWELPNCWDLPPENTNAACSDGIDNDMDGDTDCDDTNCNPMFIESLVVCADGAPVVLTDAEVTSMADARCSDMDGNGNDFVDCMDNSCRFDAAVTVCPANPEAASDETCSDGIDNDGNDFIDCRDFACSRNPTITVCEN